MGVVYKAFDPHIVRTVAIKTIRREVGDDDHALLARFRNEAQAAGRLSHPGIVAVYDYGEEGDVAYLAMEYVEGHDLADHFRRAVSIDPRDAVSLVTQLLEALGHAHEHGVVHRDVKPSNIIVTRQGRVKVTDFGIARLDVSELTQSGVIVGTPSYMAPEQYLGQVADARSDVFSVGVLLFQLLTGQKPFQGPPSLLAYKVCHEEAPAPSTLAPSAAPLDAVVARALAKKPADRFQTADEFREAVLRAHADPLTPGVAELPRIQAVPIAPASSGQDPTPTSVSPRPGTPTPTGTAPAGWDPATLKQVEQQLAQVVGPLARVLVRRAAAHAGDLDALYTQLAGQIESDADRQRFLAARAGSDARTVAEASRTSLAGSSAGGGAIGPEIVEAATRDLTPLLGPIAKVVARKVAKAATTRDQYYLLLADELSSPADREKFLRAAGLKA
jgi:serine/threonine-protein kinase